MQFENDATEGVEIIAEPMGGYTRWARKGHERARSMLSHERRAFEAHQENLTAKAEIRDDHCWYPDCPGKPTTWVKQIGFDLKVPKAQFGNAQVDSSDYTGPVPGFCFAHVAQGPAELAQIVYGEHPAVQWGYLAKRWFVRFTDGLEQGGAINQLVHP